MGVNSLTQEEIQTVNYAAGGAVKASAVARLYRAEGSSWSYTHKWGAIAVVSEAGAAYLRLVDLKSGSVLHQQEFYQNFEYQAARPFFHTFEGDDAVYGLSFADEADAANLHRAVTGAGAGGPAFGGAAKGLPPTPARPAMPSSAPPARPAAPPPAAMGSYPSAAPPMAPSASYPSMPTTAPPAPSPSASMPTLNRQPSVPGSGGSALEVPGGAKKAGTGKKGSRIGGFSRMFKKMTDTLGMGAQEQGDVQLSGPTGFRHESHIGWDPTNGFEIRNIPPEWRKLFQAAGVKKSELRDGETAKFIMDTVAQAMTGPPPPGGAGGPPPPPPPAPGAPAPPPPPSPMRVNAPAPPPPPPGGGGGYGAPPPPPGGGGGGYGAPPPPPAPTNSLLAGLQNAQLKSVEQRALPDLKNLDEAQGATLADTLARAMAARRVDMHAGDSDDEFNSGDEWSD